MRNPGINLSSRRHVVKPVSGARLKATICNFASQCGQDLAKPSRAICLRRLHSLAAGNPRGLNRAQIWAGDLLARSALPPFRSAKRAEIRDAWQELARAVAFVQAEIRSALEGLDELKVSKDNSPPVRMIRRSAKSIGKQERKA